MQGYDYPQDTYQAANSSAMVILVTYECPQHLLLEHVLILHVLRCSFDVPTLYLLCTYYVPTIYPQCTYNVPIMYQAIIVDLVATGRLPQATLDARAADVLRVKARLYSLWLYF